MNKILIPLCVLLFFLFGCSSDEKQLSISLSELDDLTAGYPKKFSISGGDFFIHRLKPEHSKDGDTFVVLDAVAKFSDQQAKVCDTIAQRGNTPDAEFFFMNNCNAILYGAKGEVVHNIGYRGAKPLTIIPFTISSNHLVIAKE